MALNKENLAKYKKAEQKGGFNGSFSDVLNFKSGTDVDVQLVLLPPTSLEGVTFPNQDSGILAHFKEVHRKLGKKAQQSCDCMKNYGKDCRVCNEKKDKTVTRFTPYVIQLHEHRDAEDKHAGFTPTSKPVVMDLPGKNGDILVSELFDEDNNSMSDLTKLPVYKYTRVGTGIDTVHTLTQRPLKYTFSIASMLMMDKEKSADGKRDISVFKKEDTGNRVFETKEDLLDWISTDPATRFIEPSDVKMRVGLQGDDMYQKKEVLEALAGTVSTVNTTTQGSASQVTTTEAPSNEVFTEDDDIIPF